MFAVGPEFDRIRTHTKPGPERRARNFAAPKLPSEPRDPREKLRARAKSSALMRRGRGKLARRGRVGQYASASAGVISSTRPSLPVGSYTPRSQSSGTVRALARGRFSRLWFSLERTGLAMRQEESVWAAALR